MKISGYDKTPLKNAQKVLIEEACQKAIEKAGVLARTSSIFSLGDLINQIFRKCIFTNFSFFFFINVPSLSVTSIPFSYS
ncbi:hypothetical protein [Metabacillus bambusae]|uniref:hypothetical protein n=1 Tax=Metabacillus bambusae TaxID=2795218 RepID=UPI001FB0E4E2